MPTPAPTSVVAHPGDDLNALANTYGTVRLAAGVYPMSQPLVLNRPVNLVADPGVTLLFSQAPDASTWTAAIKVRASHTTLSGFAVRFAGPVRWTPGVAYGPAVIGATDNDDAPNGDPLLALTFTKLDLQAPPASTAWEEAAHLLRLANAGSGTIADNRLYGGTTEFFGGPWTVTGNTFLGTPPNTFTYTAFAMHYTHDVTVAGNTVAPQGQGGKTWRFLVMTENGIGDTIRNNTVIGVGPMDADTVVNPNAPEVILSEAYTVHYEGVVGSVSADGRVVTVPTVQSGRVRTGDVVAILSGPQAGQWRMVAQVLDATTYVLDAPLAPGAFAVSVVTGFVNEMYRDNTIDARGSSTANGLVLAGNQFGAGVVGNHFLGGNRAFELTAYPSETPSVWGWTHAPFLGATISGNTIEDTLNGGLIDVLHNGYSKSDTGRVYFSGVLTDNNGVWSPEFLAGRASNASALGLGAPSLVTVGDALSADPGELVLTVSGNTAGVPTIVLTDQTIRVVSGTVNGVAQRPPPPVRPAPTPAPTAASLVVRYAAAGVTSASASASTFSPGAAASPDSSSGASGSSANLDVPPEALPLGFTSAPATLRVLAAGPSPVADEGAAIRIGATHPRGPDRDRTWIPVLLRGGRFRPAEGPSSRSPSGAWLI
jgi:hypothetical protein